MKIYFAEVEKKDTETLGESKFFQYGAKYYDYMVELTADGIVIRDSIDRVFPLWHGDLEDLIKALILLRKPCGVLAAAEVVLDSINAQNATTVI